VVELLALQANKFGSLGISDKVTSPTTFIDSGITTPIP
jgi:hypothetical protein